MFVLRHTCVLYAYVVRLHEHVPVLLVFSDKMSQAGDDGFGEAFRLFISLWLVGCDGKVLCS